MMWRERGSLPCPARVLGRYLFEKASVRSPHLVLLAPSHMSLFLYTATAQGNIHTDVIWTECHIDPLLSIRTLPGIDLKALNACTASRE